MEEKYLDPEIERLTELYQKDPTSRIFAPLADAYRKSKLFDEAVDILKKGLEIHPNYVSAHLVLARCYYEKDMLQLAKGSLERVLELDQQNVIALRLLGDILSRMGDQEGALARYKEVTDIDPNNLEVRALAEKMVSSSPRETESPPVEPRPVQPAASPENAPHFSDFMDAPEPDTITGTHLASEEETPLKNHTESVETKETPEKSFLLLTPETEEAQKEEGVSPSTESPKSAETGFATLTLAEIYEEQGFLEKALEVYKQLIQDRPNDEEIRARVENLTAKLEPKPQPEPENHIDKSEASFTGLIGETEFKEEEKPNNKQDEKKGDFSAFKQWLEGLSENGETE